MEEEFVPYELAVKLKELGFDKECFGGYIRLSNGDFELAFYKDRLINFNKESNIYVSAPLWQQAFDFMLNLLPELQLLQDRKSFDVKYFSDSEVKYLVFKGDRINCLEAMIEFLQKKNK